MREENPLESAQSTILEDPPEAWFPARRLLLTIRQPIEQFLHVQAAGGILLLVAAAAALVWANSPAHHAYEHLWHTEITLGWGRLSFTKDVHFWINEGLMTVFFLVVGLEVKREIAEGELSELRRAALPLAAAVGGMIVPAVLYFALNQSGHAANGWGVPMATDIAFAVGVLTLLGNRVPAALRVLLLALAIVDDIGAILVIAIFYSSLDMSGVPLLGIGLAGLFLVRYLGVRPGWGYAVPGLLVWIGLFRMGVHPTLAGVIVGLAVPVKPWYGRKRFLGVARHALSEFERVSAQEHPDDHELFHPLHELATAQREAVSPAARLNTELHPYVAYFIMPLFAFANAGVYLGGLDFNVEGASFIVVGVIVGLAIGKPLGIVTFSLLANKLGIAAMPRGVGVRGLLVVGCVGGIGFTMAIFIAELAFAGNASALGVAKLGVLIGTGVAAILGLGLGRFVLPKPDPTVAHITPGMAEQSTEF